MEHNELPGRYRACEILSRMRILLIRHGQTSDVPPRWPSGSQLRAWFEGYVESGLATGEVPPQHLRKLLEGARIVSSDLRRAIESAALLASGAEVQASPLLREMSVVIPSFSGLRLPLKLWAVVVGVPFMRAVKRNLLTSSYAKELERARDTAEWLSSLAVEHHSVAAVTHGAFRTYLAFALERRGWQPSPARRRSEPWSAWELTMDPETSRHS